MYVLKMYLNKIKHVSLKSEFIINVKFFIISGWCIIRVRTKGFYSSWFGICMPNSGGTRAEEIRVCRDCKW